MICEGDKSTTARQDIRFVRVTALVAGLACGGIGLYGAIDSIVFGIGAERATATTTRTVTISGDSYPLLEFAVAGKEYGIPPRGAFGALTPNVRTYELLYPPGRPEDARLAHWQSRFAIPLILLALGLMFMLVGLLPSMWVKK